MNKEYQNTKFLKFVQNQKEQSLLDKVVNVTIVFGRKRKEIHKYDYNIQIFTGFSLFLGTFYGFEKQSDFFCNKRSRKI